jgi:hypothetical protein
MKTKPSQSVSSYSAILQFLLSCCFFSVLVFFGVNASAANEVVDAPEQEVSTVYLSVGVLDVDSISSAQQSFTLNIYLQFRWFDPALAHAGDNTIRRNLNEIHAPRFLLVNRQKTWSTLLNVVDISPQGEALYRMRLWGDFSQPLHLQDFPFDAQEFNIPIVALGDGNPVKLLPDPESESFMASSLSVADWRITDWSGDTSDIEITRDDSVEGFIFRFRAERIYNHLVIKFIIPLILIVMMSWIVFWIDPLESASQLSVAVTAALTLIAYHIALAGKLPDIPYLTRMDMFLFGSTLMVFSALLEVVITSRLARVGRLKLARWIDRVCSVLFPAAYIAISGYALGVPHFLP